MVYKYYGTLAHNTEDNVWEVSFENSPEPATLKEHVKVDSKQYDKNFQLPFEFSKSEV